ncbi:UDP-N-acetylglucosamine--N-acetylmuramyl-(pentapeptide) pyrophosphoryl-undecaprenol N-acetylglucosamine transferase [Thermaurantimonas aggregans]|uniref:UDP-N-acetylglucosamine--N-acetylmuramyl-(pentapeptide) pyrophosphoryl-undecaprenol N-acetylglucosamine transferase n=2 Tax=Thermaurantimonas aggregans TaxID=2173829 RepID=A0A401XLN6_9FLAO|nr:UDP-N-acetylglucosamine--N-acetylmuramyl-(pentapeptide) pyrophosphoryl-undecaprenol N-acetylglucosamine transferase [Thermaurantimonas aggregans]
MLSGGGTGGHIFPALSIADELKRRLPEAKFLFVGALGRMEMTQIPNAGYEIVGLPITGLQRSFSLKNFLVPFKLLYSIVKSIALLRHFKPNAVIGTGGFASGPLVMAAGLLNIPVFLQEQNSYPGIVNRWAGRFARKIFVAYEGMDKYLPAEKILITGNPIRAEIVTTKQKDPKVAAKFLIDPSKPTVLVVGGSLGARSINQAIDSLVNEIQEKANLVWICGKIYFDTYRKKYPINKSRFYLDAFAADLYEVYPWAEIVISRAGAGTLSELSAAGKACILIPSPNVAENHQLKNAKAFAEKKAAIVIEEKNLSSLKDTLMMLLTSAEARVQLEQNIKLLAKPDATQKIADEILKAVIA